MSQVTTQPQKLSSINFTINQEPSTPVEGSWIDKRIWPRGAGVPTPQAAPRKSPPPPQESPLPLKTNRAGRGKAHALVTLP